MQIAVNSALFASFIVLIFHLLYNKNNWLLNIIFINSNLISYIQQILNENYSNDITVFFIVIMLMSLEVILLLLFFFKNDKNNF